MLNSTVIFLQVFSKYSHLEVVTLSFDPSESFTCNLFLPSLHYLVWSLCACLMIHIHLVVGRIPVGRIWECFISGSCIASSTQSEKQLLLNEEEGCWVQPFWEKEVSLLESLALNRLTGITWLTKRSGYTHCPRKLRIKGGSLWIFRVRRKSITTNPPEAHCLKWI